MKYLILFLFSLSIFLSSCKEEKVVNVSQVLPEKVNIDTFAKSESSDPLATNIPDSKIDIEESIPKVEDKTPKEEKKISQKEVVKSKTTKSGEVAQIRFESDTYDFGRIVQGQTILHEYVFTNLGTKPLVITDAVATCGCTKPIYPFAPIEAGETGKILIQFHSTGRLGRQNPSIKVFSNSGKEPVLLKLVGEVITEKFSDTLSILPQ